MAPLSSLPDPGREEAAALPGRPLDGGHETHENVLLRLPEISAERKLLAVIRPRSLPDR